MDRLLVCALLCFGSQGAFAHVNQMDLLVQQSSSEQALTAKKMGLKPLFSATSKSTSRDLEVKLVKVSRIAKPVDQR